MEQLNFSELALSQEVQSAITDMGFATATPIQSEAIPHLLNGKDLIGQAQTGTGKTAAFGIPLLESIDCSTREVAAIVLCPTRELAVQVAEELRKLAKYKKGLFISTIYGGDSIQRQLKELKSGPQVVVGTPGRVMDHLKRKTLRLETIEMVVLDEADEMLNMGFREDIESILAQMPVSRQTVLFSATMPKPIMDIARRFQNSPVHIKVVKEELTNASIDQVYYDIPVQAKEPVIARLIEYYDLQRVIVFANMKKTVDDLTEGLNILGISAKAIHGDLNQNQRNAVLTAFRAGSVNVLVATDVAARGIDVSAVDGVFNYDLPYDAEYYVHRIGRTGRAGKLGKSFSFVTGRNDRYRLRDIEDFSKVRIERRNVPTVQDLAKQQQAKLWEKVTETIAEGDLEDYEIMARDFCKTNGLDSRQLAMALVKLSMPNINAVEIPNLNAERERRPAREGEQREQRGEYRGGNGGGNFNGPRGNNNGGGYKSGPPRKKEYGSPKGDSYAGKKPGGKKKYSREMV
jgi:ATP-dependent RNA helicase DeaD